MIEDFYYNGEHIPAYESGYEQALNSGQGIGVRDGAIDNPEYYYYYDKVFVNADNIPFSYFIRFDDSSNIIIDTYLELYAYVLDLPELAETFFGEYGYLEVAAYLVTNQILFFSGPDDGDPRSKVIDMFGYPDPDPNFPIVSFGDILDNSYPHVNIYYSGTLWTLDESDYELGAIINNDPLCVWEYQDSVGYDRLEAAYEYIVGGSI